MFSTIFSGIFLLTLFLVPFYVYKSLKASKNGPPSPRKLPILGNLHQLGSLPHRSLQLLSKQYGPLMLLHLGNVPVLIASSADAAREILKTHDLIFASRPKASIPDRLVYGSKDIAFAPYGEYWRQVRSIGVLHLLSNKMVQSFRSVREEETSLMIDKIAELSSQSALINFSDEFVLLTNDVVCRVAFGRKFSDGEIGRKFKLQIRELVELLGSFNIGNYLPWLEWVNRFNGVDARVKKTVIEFDNVLEGVVEEHRRKTDNDIGDVKGSDFVDVLLKIQRENLAGFPIQNETIKAIIMDMFVGGTDTTQTLIEWAMSELIRNPKVMDKLQNEVRQVGQGKSELCEDNLEEMHYLKAVIKETLRLHALVPLLVAREATQNVNLMGYEIKAGTQVFINAWAIGRDPSLWENSEDFYPERFLNSTIDYKGFNFELIPFGAGRRGCPAITFAINVNELALAKLVHKFDFALPNGLKGEGLDMSEAYGLIVQRKFPLILVASPYKG